VPNINPDFPLFHSIFTFAGFYIIPPIFGVSFSPLITMVSPVLISMGLRKIYLKFYAKDEPKIVIISKDEFEKKFNQLNTENKEDKQDDGN
jgi:hypothetical protein